VRTFRLLAAAVSSIPDSAAKASSSSASISVSALPDEAEPFSQ